MRFFGPREQGNNLDQLQNRISLVFSALGAVLMVILSISDFFLGLGPTIIVTKFLFSFPYLIGFFVMRRYGYHHLVIQFLIFIGLILVAANYFYNAGFRGPTIYTIFIFVVGVAILVKGWPKFVWMFFIFTLYSLLFYSEVAGLITVEYTYTGIDNLLWDHLITIWW